MEDKEVEDWQLLQASTASVFIYSSYCFYIDIYALIFIFLHTYLHAYMHTHTYEYIDRIMEYTFTPFI